MNTMHMTLVSLLDRIYVYMTLVSMVGIVNPVHMTLVTLACMQGK